MKKSIALLIFTFIFFGRAIQAQDFTAIDDRTRNTDFSQNGTVEELAAALTEGCTTEKEKVRAFFVWIADNVRYDIKTFEDRDEMDPVKRVAKQQAGQVMKDKKGVCEGYANLMQALCERSNIAAFIVAGVTKDHKGRVSRGRHAWNIVRADGVWGLIDPTWGSGDVDMEERKYKEVFKPHYFFTAPSEMIENHFPDDPLFQLLPNPISEEAFRQFPASTQPLKNKINTSYEHFRDSLNAFAQLDTLQQQLRFAARKFVFDPKNNRALFIMAGYHYNIGFDWLNKHDANRIALNSSKRPMDKKYIKEQLKYIAGWKASLKESLKYSTQSSGIDSYSKNNRQYKILAERAMKQAEKMEEKYREVKL